MRQEGRRAAAPLQSRALRRETRQWTFCPLPQYGQRPNSLQRA